MYDDLQCDIGALRARLVSPRTRSKLRLNFNRAADAIPFDTNVLYPVAFLSGRSRRSSRLRGQSASGDITWDGAVGLIALFTRFLK